MSVRAHTTRKKHKKTTLSALRATIERLLNQNLELSALFYGLLVQNAGDTALSKAAVDHVLTDLPNLACEMRPTPSGDYSLRVIHRNLDGTSKPGLTVTAQETVQ